MKRRIRKVLVCWMTIAMLTIAMNIHSTTSYALDTTVDEEQELMMSPDGGAAANIDTEVIAEEEIPLAADLRTADCLIHWLILLLTVLFSGFGITRCVLRGSKIRQSQKAEHTVTEQ